MLVSEFEGSWYVTLFTGSYANPYDTEVPGAFETVEEAKAVAVNEVDRMIRADVEWEESNLS